MDAWGGLRPERLLQAGAEPGEGERGLVDAEEELVGPAGCPS